jgi:hypothetical protein
MIRKVINVLYQGGDELGFDKLLNNIRDGELD